MAAPGIFIWGYSPESLREESSAVRCRGEGPIENLEDEVPHKLKQFADIVYRFSLQKRSKFKNSHNSPPDS